MNAWLVILGVGAGTYLLRASMFVVLGGRSLPRWTETPMSLIAPAAIAALVASMLFGGSPTSGSLEIAAAPEVAAVAAGFVAVRRSGNIMLAFAVGMPVFWLLSLVIR